MSETVEDIVSHPTIVVPVLTGAAPPNIVIAAQRASPGQLAAVLMHLMSSSLLAALGVHMRDSDEGLRGPMALLALKEASPTLLQ